MNAIGIAALIAAVSFAVLALTGVVVAIKLNKLFGATTKLVREAGEGHDTILARVNAAVDRTNEQLDRTEAVTSGMDKLGEGVNELAGQVNALTEFGRTLAGSIVGGPVGRAAAVAYGVRHAIGLRTTRRRTLSGEVIRTASPDRAASPDHRTVSPDGNARAELARGRRGGRSHGAFGGKRERRDDPPRILASGRRGGIWGYRRVAAVGRDVSARLDGSPRTRKVRRGMIRGTLRFSRDARRFTRDVREGMDLYIARHEGPAGNTLGPSEDTNVKEDR